MRKLLLIAGMVALTALPAVASAQTSCEQARHDKRVTGTVVGAVGGAILGGLLGGNRGHKESGAIVGGVGGAVVGNQLSKSGPCPDGQVPHDRNAYYDRDGNYHTSFTDRDGVYHSGFYDRDGGWHANYEGPPVRTWRDRDGRMCGWEDRTYTDDNGYTHHRQEEVCRN
jgi:hypothetical protein